MGKVELIDERCFGCGACWSVAPDNFTCNDTGRTTIINNKITDAAIEASEICPASAIIINKDCTCNETCTCNENCNCECSNEYNCGDKCECSHNNYESEQK